MSVAPVACRFCLKKQEAKHTTALFTGHSRKAGIPVLMGTIFDVNYPRMPVDITLPLLHAKLLKLRALAEASYRNAQTGIDP